MSLSNYCKDSTLHVNMFHGKKCWRHFLIQLSEEYSRTFFSFFKDLMRTVWTLNNPPSFSEMMTCDDFSIFHMPQRNTTTICQSCFNFLTMSFYIVTLVILINRWTKILIQSKLTCHLAYCLWLLTSSPFNALLIKVPNFETTFICPVSINIQMVVVSSCQHGPVVSTPAGKH